MTGSGKQEAQIEKLETGSGKLETGSGKLKTDVFDA
jgi:X-X-X-Leu-X-X-Gly heptad repeat protein